ncbi:phosphatidylethanolamine-binding protein [Pholiota molesta]|nr:phosphatidylethanolamine-binding protein [Pholiota molesta]
MLPVILSIGLFLNSAFAQTDALSNVTTAFSMAQIVPDVIDSFDPMALINITFTDSVTMDTVDVVPGILLTMEQTADEPMFFLDTSESDSNMDMSLSTFVLIIVDPDAPTPQMPNISEFLHFVGGDFMADSTTGLLSNSSPALMEFFSPTPPPGSDPHRYVVLVFDQPDGFDTTASMFVNATTPRTNFSASDFVMETNLGSPIAGTYFLVGPDDSSSTSSTTDTNTDTATPTDIPTSPPDTESLPVPTLTTDSVPSLPTDTSTDMPANASPTSASAGMSITMYRPGDKAAAGLAILSVLVVYLL